MGRFQNNATEKLLSCHHEISSAILHATDTIKKFVQEEGGFIDARNLHGECDSLYAFAYDGETTEEYQVFGLKIFKGSVFLYLGELSSAPPQSLAEMKDDKNNWIPLDPGSEILFSVTVMQLTETLPQYSQFNL